MLDVTILKKVYNGVISSELLNKIIEELEKIDELKESKNLKKLKNFNILKHGYILQYLSKNTIKEFLLELNKQNQEMLNIININNVEISTFKELLKDAKEEDPIFKLDYFNGKIVKELNKEEIKKLLSNLEKKKLEKLNCNNIEISTFKELLSEAKDRDSIFKLNYFDGEIFKELNKEEIKKLLSNLEKKKLEKLNCNNIEISTFKELLSEAKDRDLIFKLDYFNGKIFKELNEEEIKKILSNLEKEKFEKIDPNNIEISTFKELLSEAKEGDPIFKLSYFDGEIFKELNKEEIKKILSNLDKEDLEKINPNNIKVKFFRELLSEAKEGDFIFELNYDHSFIFRKLNKDETKKMLLNIYDKKILKKIKLNNIRIFNEILDDFKSDDHFYKKIKFLDFKNGENLLYLSKENIKKILSNLDNENLEKIDPNNIKISIFKELLDEAEKGDPIFKLNYFNREIFKELDKEEIKKLLSNLDKEDLEKIDPNNIGISTFKELLKDAKEGDPIFKINYYKGDIFRELNEEETKKFLSYLDKERLGNTTPIFIKNFNELLNNLESEDPIIKKIKLLNFNDGKIFLYLSEENTKKVLSFLDEEKIKNINPIYIKNFKKLENDLNDKNKENNLYKNIKLLLTKYKEKQIEDFSFEELAEKYENPFEYFGNIISNNEYYSENSLNIIAKKIEEMLEEDNYLFECIMPGINEDFNFFISLLSRLDEANIIKFFKKIIVLEKINFINVFFSTFSETNKNYEPNPIIENILLQKIGKDNYEKMLLESFILPNSFYEIGDISDKKFIEVISKMEKDKIINIDLSNVTKNNKEKIEKIIKGLCNNNIEKFPKFNIDSISRYLLFSLIKENKIDSSNFTKKEKSGKSKSAFSFLEDESKFKFIQKIIQDDLLFDKSGKYNDKMLKQLNSILNINEIYTFLKFYCEEFHEPKIPFNKEDLKILNNKKVLIDPKNKIYQDYFTENNKLIPKDSEDLDGYKKNRQENLYLLIKKLRGKLLKRLGRIGNADAKIEKEIKNKIFRLEKYLAILDNCRKDDFTTSLCDKEEAEIIVEFLVEQYYRETLRRIFIDFHRKIEPFIHKYLKDKAEVLIQNIDESLMVLFNPNSPNNFKLEAQKKLEENLKIIGDEYKKVMLEEQGVKVCGAYLVLSTICCANNLTELNEAIYSEVRMKIINDYVTKQKGFGDGIETNTLYRGYGNIPQNELKSIYKEIMSNPLKQTGRDKYNIFDMAYLDRKEFIDTTCNAGGLENKGESYIGTYTSFTDNPEIAIKYGTDFFVVCNIPDNLKKSCSKNYGCSRVDEIAVSDIYQKNRIFAPIFKDRKIEANEGALINNSVYNKEYNIEDVVFNEQMDFVVFNINQEKDKQETKTVDETELKELTIKAGKERNLPDFINKQLNIERVFDKHKILGTKEEEKVYDSVEKYKYEVQKTLKMERRLYKAEKLNVFNKKETIKKEKNNNKVTYTIPDIHGSYSSLIKNLKEIGLITNEKEEEFVYFRKNDRKLINPIHEMPADYNEKNYIKISKLTINENFRDNVVQLGDLIDNHDGLEEKSPECLVTSILLSRQSGGKYITLVGNHEIAKLCDNKYEMDENNKDYETSIIKEAIKNGEIKLFQHTPGTKIINSHVPLLKDNIINFLNIVILKNKNLFEYYGKKIDRLVEIMGLKINGEIYEQTENCLLDLEPSKEKDIEDFTNILNELFAYTILIENKKITESLLGTLVNDDRLYKHENGEKNLENISIKDLKKSTFKGITNIIGHDATPTGVKGGEYSDKLQEEYYKELKILFTDEWQGKKNGAKFVKIETNEKDENIIYFYKEKDDKYTLYNFDNKEMTIVPIYDKNKIEENDLNLSKDIKDIDLNIGILSSFIGKQKINELENMKKEINNISPVIENKIMK